MVYADESRVQKVWDRQTMLEKAWVEMGMMPFDVREGAIYAAVDIGLSKHRCMMLARVGQRWLERHRRVHWFDTHIGRFETRRALAIGRFETWRSLAVFVSVE